MNNRTTSDSTLSDRLHSMVGDLYSQTRKNARKRGIPFSLTREELGRIFERAGGRCEVSGVPFVVVPARGRRRPFAPSIDRKDSSKGYTFRNCRLVCVAVNFALNEWGDDVFLKIAASCPLPDSDPAVDDLMSERDALLAENKSLRNEIHQLRQKGYTDEENAHQWEEFKQTHGLKAHTAP